MLTFNEQYTRALDICKDSSTANTTRIKEFINSLESNIIGDKDWYFLEKEREADTVASQQDYRLPPDYGRFKNLKITVSSVVYNPTEVLSFEEWNYLNQTTTTSDIPSKFFISDDYLKIYPTPASDSNTIGLTYTLTHKDMSQADYVTGTIDNTAGSRTVTGAGTTFTDAMEGRWIKISGRWFEIETYVGATSLTLAKATITGCNDDDTQLGEMSILPGSFHDMLWKGACALYFLFKGNNTEYQFWQAQFDKKLKRLHQRFGEKTDMQVLPRRVRDVGKFWGLLRLPEAGSLS